VPLWYFLGLILWIIFSKEGKTPNPKKVHAILNMPTLINPQQN
jgi:hypothetical protein